MVVLLFSFFPNPLLFAINELVVVSLSLAGFNYIESTFRARSPV